MPRKLFKVRTESTSPRKGRPMAAPFDVPSGIMASVTSDGMLRCRFIYLGDDEPEGSETFGGVTFGFGIVSGRLMSIMAAQTNIPAVLSEAIQVLASRCGELRIVSGKPQRQAAHYDFVGTEVIPTLRPGLEAYVAEQLKSLRNSQASH